MRPGLIIAFLIIILTSCNHRNDSCPACGVDNPSQNLAWLKNNILLYQSTDYQTLLKVDLYKYNSAQLIFFSWRLNGVQDLPSGAIYNCDGKLLYSIGGNQPFDSGAFYIGKSKYIGNIWTK